jgi:tRNA (mo5U34)-methyltransferase
LRPVNVVEQARRHRWYHTLELAPGEVTDGEVDLRPYVHHYGLPESLEGLRVLDVGTFDGFWAFEMERRGATVTAIDVPSDREIDRPAVHDPAGQDAQPREAAFELAREALGSSVERRELSVYDATPELIGQFDLVFCASVLIHLRDPVLALERLAGLCRGRLILAEAYHRWLSALPFALAHYRALRVTAPVFWEPNPRAWRRMIESAGFQQVQLRTRFKLRSRAGWSVRHAVFHARAGSPAPP